jgi:hypothetical protein
MAVTATPIYPQAVNAKQQVIVNADGTTIKALYAAGSNGSRITNINVTNTDTGAYTLQLFVQISSTDYLLGSVSIPLSAGNTNAAPTINCLNNSQMPSLPRDAQGNPFIDLPASSTLRIATTGTVASTKTVTAVAFGVDF